ncbi:cAMP-specific 3',5'-cyclic phosphodiesterase 4C isoform X3 [Arapaima gigas]
MSSTSRQKQWDTLGHCVPNSVPISAHGYVVRRRFSGSIYLPQLSRRHSAQDARKVLDYDALSRLTRLGSRGLDTVANPPSDRR